ncbi:MAG: hypothetical protein QM779_08180 [Propionicimonas sp.]|uniref:hypothetical protein n=1 Tax=Propionicimonas sp. TaxID=1955623 RepID=UPI003D0B6700
MSYDSPSRGRIAALRDAVLAQPPPIAPQRVVPLNLDCLVALGTLALADVGYELPPAIHRTLLLLPDAAWERAEVLAARHDRAVAAQVVAQAEVAAIIAAGDEIDPDEWPNPLDVAIHSGRAADKAGATWFARPRWLRRRSW